MRGLPALLYLMWRASFAVASKCNTFSSASGYGNYLKNHLVQSIFNTSLQDCTNQCVMAGFCRSTNFHSQSKTCELNNADKHDNPDDYIERLGYTYSGWQTKRLLPNSCSEAKQRKPSAKSGYYVIKTKRGKRKTVYCDMDKDDGGWTLVVSVSSTDNGHLQRAKNNCFNSSLCVEYETRAIVGRKLSDQNIIDISEDGVFRIDVHSGPSSPFSVFYKIPSGVQDFDSSCTGLGPPACPRIIISYHYPYQWESNSCNNISVGYRISTNSRHFVFDGHDGSECGEAWHSSEFSAWRVLYGYGIQGYYGIYEGKQGLVFVK